MGTRVLKISPELLVDFLKAHDGMRRTYTVRAALPDDARIKDGRIAWNQGGVVEVVLESAEWQDHSVSDIEVLPPVEVSVHYLEGGDVLSTTPGSGTAL